MSSCLPPEDINFRDDGTGPVLLFLIVLYVTLSAILLTLGTFFLSNKNKQSTSKKEQTRTNRK